MQKILLVISIFLNLLLFIAVFFRSALNEILKDWWTERRQAKKEHKHQLFNLRSHLLKISRLSSTILIFQAMINSKEDTAIKIEMFNNSKPTLSQWHDINNIIEENCINYPPDIRKLYAKYRREMGKATEEVFLKSVHDQHSLTIMMDEVMSTLGSLIEKVNDYLEK